MALSRSIAGVAREMGFRPGLQLLGEGALGLRRWPFGKTGTIVAGGALGREKRIQLLAEKFGDYPERVALLGMSFWSSDDLSTESMDFLRACKYISCRNRKDMKYLKNAGFQNVHFAFDNAFALPTNPAQEKPTRPTPVLGVNVVSRNMKRIDDSYFVPSEDSNFGPTYINIVRDLVESHIRKGWEVQHIPFTHSDSQYANFVFEGLPVQMLPYQYRVSKVLGAVAKTKRFIASRYHAHVFALRTRTPLISISYAPKCDYLQQDLDIPEDVCATYQQISSGSHVNINKEGFTVSRDKNSRIQKDVRSNISNAIDLLPSN
ncbi:hypothetical protein CRI94_13975 [Longibacter salinarum]|uniref:Polysaccharide pyruvyl transferase domain-containing protein n=2 Tax=Longibacter salinarum TaxID=1850348 RepID=A0A2A8CV30_9BACT|nr:hypothetical protein CRI94_13975 [Longibacter salinarum]